MDKNQITTNDTASDQTTTGVDSNYDKSFSDQEFAMKAAEGGMMEVELGRVATSNAADAKVKSFGQMMVDDHTKANNELMAIAKVKKMTLPDKPGEAVSSHIREMSNMKGKAFDQHYIGMMVDDHQKDIDLFQMASEKASDPDLKAFATKTLPVLKKHYSAAESLKKSLGTQK